MSFSEEVQQVPHPYLKKIEGFFIRYWWLFFCFILCYLLYEQRLRKYDSEFNALHQRLEELQDEKQRELALQKKLKRELNSQSDPSWIELVLMRELGLIPEDTTKVYYK